MTAHQCKRCRPSAWAAVIVITVDVKGWFGASGGGRSTTDGCGWTMQAMAAGLQAMFRGDDVRQWTAAMASGDGRQRRCRVMDDGDGHRRGGAAADGMGDGLPRSTDPGLAGDDNGRRKLWKNGLPDVL
ncbi:hypothetical protein ACLOJK_007091 [Asimina triloba]